MREALHLRLDPGTKTLAAQEFCHSLQGKEEGVADYIRRLEKTFHIAYGREKLKRETSDTLLYGQLYEGLRYDLVRSGSVSGYQTYRELCTAPKAEEKRLAALQQRQQYNKPIPPAKFAPKSQPNHAPVAGTKETSLKSEKVELQGVPVYGLVDNGADISIIGGSLFRKVATVARLKKRNFKTADRTPRTYDLRPFRLDGRIDLDIHFEGKTMRSPIYINAHDQLLLSEGVCRQLGIISYHERVKCWRGGRKQMPIVPEDTAIGEEVNVPVVRVNLLRSVHFLPHQSQVIDVAVETDSSQGPLLA